MASGQVHVAEDFVSQSPQYAHSGAMVYMPSASDDSPKVFSYGELIAKYRPLEGTVIVNPTKYSMTTTRHQNAVRNALAQAGYELVGSTPFGTSGIEWEEWQR